MTTMTDTNWIELAGAPAIPGLRVRRWRDVADYASMAAVAAAAYDADAVPFMPTADNLQVQIEGEDGIDPAKDLALVEVDGALVAYGEVWGVTRDGRPMFEVGGIVHPSYRRRGIGRALLAENLRRAAERAATEPADPPILVEGFVEDTEIGHRAILTKAGFEPVRHFFLMRVPDLDHIPDAPLPDGLELRPVTPDQHRAIFDAEADAFNDHWGHRDQGDDLFHTMYAEGRARHLAVGGRLGRRPDRRRRAEWIWPEENEHLGVKRGWIERISVRRPWRRRGLGRALTAESLRRLREAGMDDAMLGVDSENPTGALGLYEGLGFVVHSRAAAYRRELER